MTETLLFFVFSALLILGTGLMIFVRNVMHGAYALLLVLLCVAGFFVLLHAEFLAVVQIFMYAGGVIVLLIFGVMLTNRQKKGPPLTGHRSVLLSSVLVITLFTVFIKFLLQEPWVWQEKTLSMHQVETMGVLLLTDYLLAFEFIAILLLAVLVGASYLAKNAPAND